MSKISQVQVTIREATQADAESIIAQGQCLAMEPNIDIPLAPEEFNPTIEEEQKTLSDYFYFVRPNTCVGSFG